MAKLSVYEQLDASSRLTGLNEDIESQLEATKELKAENERLQRRVKLLEQTNQSEYSETVLKLEEQLQ